MAENGHVGFRIPEALERRHLDVVAGGREEGFRAAMTNHRTGVFEEAVGMLDPRHRIDDPVRAMIEVFGKAVDLIAIENGVSLEKRDIPLDLVATRIRFGLREAAGIDDSCAGFALANLCPDLPGLPIGHPERCFEAAGQALSPEQQHVDARIGLARVPEGSGDPAFEPTCAPGLHPGADAIFQIGDDRLGDPRIDIDARALLFPFHFFTS